MRNLTEIICIIDRSGSMDVIEDDVIGSFNSFIKSQKEETGDARMTLVTFNSLPAVLYESINLNEVVDLDRNSYRPGGGTALYDAVGQTIESVGARLASMEEDERPNKVIVVILTDGQENESKKFKKNEIAEMIEHQKTVYSWQFVFLAANQDAVLAAETIGISAGNAMYFSSSSVSMNKTSEKLSKYMSRSRKLSSEVFAATLDNALLADEQDTRDENDKKNI